MKAFIIIGSLLLSLAPIERSAMKEKVKIATFGGGCFWCVEAIFERVDGVLSVESGYSGGHMTNPDYKRVTSGTTGHAEVVQVSYDPQKITFRELLEIFFKTHDPTTLNRQGADVGTQYRSIVLFHDDEQKELAQELIEMLDLEAIWSDPIVTVVEPFEVFYKAEASHQEYFQNNPDQGYCRLVITPKIEEFEKIFKKELN